MKPKWATLLQRHRVPFLRYLGDMECRKRSLSTVADKITNFIQQSVRTSEEATLFWNAVPNVLANCDDQSTYELSMAPEAYAWLHFLDRYVRTWRTLEAMVKLKCLPLATYGINVLDIGTGPGPSILAVEDFYSSLANYADLAGEPLLVQPIRITPIEIASENNTFRARLRELERMRFTETGSFSDLLNVDLRWERAEYRERLFDELEYDEFTERYESRGRLLPWEEADAQRVHRYRLVTITNFLTTTDLFNSVQAPLFNILDDLQPGSIVVLMGGKGRHYPEIHARFDSLAAQAGLQMKVDGIEVASTQEDMEVIIQAERAIAEHIENLTPMNAGVPQEVCSALRSGKWGSKSSVRVYRRNRHKMRQAA